MTPTRKPAVVRGFAAATLATFAALAGHMTGGGQMPGPLGIVVPWVFSFMICVLLAGRKLSVVRLSASVVVSQLLFHTLFVLGTVSPSGIATPHVHGAPLVLPAGPAGSGVAEAVVADSSMWFGHALAAIVTVVVAYRGERLLLALRALAVQAVRWVRRRVDAVLASPSVLLVQELGALFERARPVDAHVLATLRGRAPPVLSAI